MEEMKTRIEYRQVRHRNSRTGYGMLIQIHVEDIVKFLEWTGLVNDLSMSIVKGRLTKPRKKPRQADMNLNVMEERVKKTRKQKPVDIYPKGSGKWSVYPHENYVEKLEVGLHYVCQHGLSILPYKVRSGIMTYYYRDEPQVIGTLYPLEDMKTWFPDTKESYPVTDRDVSDGLSLDGQAVKEYSNMFTVWVIKRNSL